MLDKVAQTPSDFSMPTALFWCHQILPHLGHRGKFFRLRQALPARQITGIGPKEAVNHPLPASNAARDSSYHIKVTGVWCIEWNARTLSPVAADNTRTRFSTVLETGNRFRKAPIIHISDQMLTVGCIGLRPFLPARTKNSLGRVSEDTEVIQVLYHL